MIILTAVLILTGCAQNETMRQAGEYLGMTPAQHCRDAETLSQYDSLEECKAGVANKQAQISGIIGNMQAHPFVYQPVMTTPNVNYYPAYQAPRPINCTSQNMFGRIQTTCH